MPKSIKAWYFAAEDNKLRYGDGREIVIGETHTIEGKLELCKHGLHASRRLIDALAYAPGPMLYQVELSGDMDIGEDKIAAQSRAYVRGFDGTSLLRDFARKCALDVVHLWDAPDVVVQYLKTGDESLRAAAWDAARAVAWAAARAAARAAAWDAARAAAWDAAGDAAWDAAGDAAWDAARAVAWAAARAAAWDKQNRRLTAMVVAEFKRQEKG